MYVCMYVCVYVCIYVCVYVVLFNFMTRKLYTDDHTELTYSAPEQEPTFKNLYWELPELEKSVKYISLTVLSEKEVI